MTRKAKVITVAIIAAVVIGIVAIVILALNGNSNGAVVVNNYTLEKGNISSKISASGTVSSITSKNIYSSAPYEILEVNVKVGDKVKAGDVLCTIDDATIKKNIAVAEASLEKSNLSTYNALQTAERRYNELLETSKGNINYNDTEVMINKAKTALDDAQKNFDEAKADLEDIKSSDTYKDAISAYEIADNARRLAQKQYDEELDKIGIQVITDQAGNTTEFEFDEGTTKAEIAKYETKVMNLRKAILDGTAGPTYQEAYDTQYDKLLDALPEDVRAKRVTLESALANYDKASRALDKVAKTVTDNFTDAKNALESAQLTYNNAVKGIDSDLADAKAAYELALKNAEDDTSLLELTELKKVLADCTVVAETDGTVIAVNATEGSMASPSSILFIVADTDNLKIEASVKEYDIGKIKVGQNVEITSDVVEGAVYEGVVSLVAPAATQNTSAYSTSTDTKFAIEVDITSPSTELLIGMNAKTNIITDSVDDTFFIRYDGILESDDGTYVYVAQDNGDGTYTAKKIPVELGLETDIEAEIISSELSEGDIIIMDIEKINDGDIVSLKKPKSDAAGQTTVALSEGE